MNKVILGLILAVCVLGLALVMLNDRLGRKPESSGTQTTAEEQSKNIPPIPELEEKSGTQSQTTNALPPRSSEEIEKAARAYEINEAMTALSPPAIKEESPAREETSALLPQTDREKPAITPAPIQKPESKPEVASKVIPKPEPKPETRAEAKPDLKADIKAEAKPETKPEAKTETKPAPTVAADPKVKNSEKTIQRFVIFSREKGATIRIGGNQNLNYKSMVLENPNRVVLDLGGDWKFPPNPGIPKNDLVNSIRVGKNEDKTRVVIDLKEKPTTTRFVPTQNGTGLDVRIDK